MTLALRELQLTSFSLDLNMQNSMIHYEVNRLSLINEIIINIELILNYFMKKIF